MVFRPPYWAAGKNLVTLRPRFSAAVTSEGHGAGEDGQVDVDAVLHDVLVVTRGDDELGAGGADLLNLLDGQDGAGANAHLGLGGGHSGDALGGAGGAEGDLGGLHTSCHKGVSERSGVLDLVEHDDRHDAQGFKRGVELIEHGVPFDVRRARARDCQRRLAMSRFRIGYRRHCLGFKQFRNRLRGQS